MGITKTDVRIEKQIGRSYLNWRLKKNYLYKLKTNLKKYFMSKA